MDPIQMCMGWYIICIVKDLYSRKKEPSPAKVVFILVDLGIIKLLSLSLSLFFFRVTWIELALYKLNHSVDPELKR